mgnify:CR=1 FL=1
MLILYPLVNTRAAPEGKRGNGTRCHIACFHRGDNEKDLAEIPENVKGLLEIVPVSMVDEVLSMALTHEPIPAALTTASSNEPPVTTTEKAENENDIVAH